MSGRISLPERTTRGKRINAALEEGDEDFWNQEFFADEAADIDYQAEPEEEDVVDSDFDVPEEEDDEPDGDEKERPRKKLLKPPSGPKLAKRKPDKGGGLTRTASAPAETFKPSQRYFEAPNLRKSTRDRIAEAVKERLRTEQAKPKRQRATDQGYRPLTQEELLAEAARTELENMESLKLMVAWEEEVKRKAMVVKKAFAGPILRVHSFKRHGESVVYWEACNQTHVPDWMKPQTAPPPPPKRLCAVTGQPAKYLDPLTGLPYVSKEAFAALRQQQGAQPSHVRGLTKQGHRDDLAGDARGRQPGRNVGDTSSGAPASGAQLEAQVASSLQDCLKYLETNMDTLPTGQRVECETSESI